MDEDVVCGCCGDEICYEESNVDRFYGVICNSCAFMLEGVRSAFTYTKGVEDDN